MKKLLSVCLSVVLLLLLLPVIVSANSPPIPDFYRFTFSNLPEGTAYVDLLIRLSPDDEHYQDLVESSLPEGFSSQSQIVTYCDDDYRSYTFHYQDALSQIAVQVSGDVTFFADFSDSLLMENTRYKHMDDIKDRGRIRLAMLDEQGNILKISKPLSTDPKGAFAVSKNVFHYDAKQDSLTIESYTSYAAAVFYILFALCGMIVTCILEWLVLKLFGLKLLYTRLVVITNIISQILMHIINLILQAVLPLGQVWVVVILELMVYTGEFLFYRAKMQTVTWKRCLAYTVAANTVSLLAGLWLFY